MNLYSSILKTNQNHKHRQATSITMASGEVRKYTYEALFNEADVYAKKMIDAGIVKGDRVVIVAENSPQWQMAFLAIMQIQGTAVLIDASLPEEALKEMIEQADARCIFASIAVKEKLGEGSQYRVPMFNLSKDGEVFKDSFSVVSPFIERTKDPMPDIAIIFFDGQIKEEIKGAMYTHEAMIKQVKFIIREHALSRNEHILSIVSNSKIEGLVAGVLTTMIVGATIHYMESLDCESLSRALKGFKPTIFMATSGVLKQLKQQLEKTLQGNMNYEAQLEKCERVREKTNVKLANMLFKQIVQMFGGRLEMIWSYSLVPEEIIRFYYALGVDILLNYGRIETNTPILGNREVMVEKNTYGSPYPEIEIELRQPNEKKQGEMYVKSPYGMKGYFRNQEAYKKYFEEGWFKTGDLAELTPAGYVKVLDSVNHEEEKELKDLGGIANKTNAAYYWFNTWKKASQCLYKVTITNEVYIPEDKGCIIYSPFETHKGYLGLTIGYSKERFFKFGYLTNAQPLEKMKIEDEAFGKIYYQGETIGEDTKRICIDQLAKGWAIIVRAPKDSLNARFTEEVIQLAKSANVPIVPAYLEGEEAIFSGKESNPKIFDLQAKKRYCLSLRYGKPIEMNEESGMIKRKIQECFTALIENHPQEEEETIDDVTKKVLEILSKGKSEIHEMKREETQNKEIEKVIADFQDDELEDITVRIDLKELLAMEESILEEEDKA